MFANRRSSQKPDEDFYAQFKQSFPEVGPGTSSSSHSQTVPASTQLGSTSISEAVVEPSNTTRPYDHVDEANKETGVTPKPFTDQWRLTPSLMDPNSFAFSAFANQPPGYYTPTPGGFNTFYHSSAAGDLHTPGMGMTTPLSMPHSIHGLHAPDPTLHFGPFNPQLLHPHQAFHDAFQAHAHHHHHHHYPHEQQHIQTTQTYAPTQLLQHQDSGYAALDDSSNKTTPNQTDINSLQPPIPPPISQLDSGVSIPTYSTGEKFRFHTTLNAPTAMIRNTDEIPVTYLNKGQAYTMSIYDTTPPSNSANLKYRTYVRISFEDEQQRARPGACWQLWREGRGSNEAHQRGGKLLAVEYVDPNQGGDDEIRKPRIELERASFDGFVVTWYPSNRASGVADCSISVRFNFLSTDFSHSKGVKGIPVRLCAKTELLTSNGDASSDEADVCFAKVKLFRDHGAERKLSNDIAHVKKSIEKLKQQIAQAEAGIGVVGKRKRSGSMAKEIGKGSAEEDLHMKLVGLQDMFSSTRPMSVLYLRGDPEDDPDLFPVKLVGGDELKLMERTQTWESRLSGSESGSNAGSPTPSSVSITPKRKFSELQRSTIFEEEEDGEEKKAVFGRSTSPERPAKMIKRESESVRKDLYALDVDSSYLPPPERPIKPVACFYVREKEGSQQYYRAVYLLQRSVKDLINGISEKFNIDPNRVTRVTHVNAKGLHIIVDEDVVREVPEGQDMTVEFAPAEGEAIVKHETQTAAPSTAVLVDGDLPQPVMNISDPLEMWLNY